MNQKINLPKALVGHSPWSASPTPIRVLSHYTIRRNLSHYPFPLSLSPRERATISDLLKDALLKCVPDTPLHLPISSLSQLDKSYLTEKFFWQDNLQRLPSEAKIYMPPSFAWQALLNGKTTSCYNAQAPTPIGRSPFVCFTISKRSYHKT